MARNNFSIIMSGKPYSIGKSLVVYRHTETIGPMGHASAIATSSYALTADIQFITVDDKELIDAGWAQIGDARLYTFDSTNLVTPPREGDEVNYLGDWFEFTAFREGPRVGDDEIFQSWILKRREETGDEGPS